MFRINRMAAWCCAFIMLVLAPLAHAADDYLEPEKAFVFSAKMRDPGSIAVSFSIADGYYMYRERFQFEAVGASLDDAVFPPGKVKFDETFQKDVETYRKAVTIVLPLKNGEAVSSFTLIVTSQGCADKGLCYAPLRSEVKLSAAGGGLSAAIGAARESGLAGSSGAGYASDVPNQVSQSRAGTDLIGSGMDKIESSLQSRKLILILPWFVLLGLGLSFTPCVLPMVPILSFIIVGEGAQVSRKRGFILSLAYALGMAIVYTILGISAGLAGEGLAAALQNPWVLAAFALLMAGLSLSMFNVYQLQVPAFIQNRLAQASGKQSSGKLAGVFVMGAISALIVGPCVAAPLAGALLYISQTRDVVIGGAALFAMAMGMSVPLLLLGLSAGTLLPRAGLWMESVKQFFGVLMLAMAWWMVAPIMPAWLQMLGWAGLGLGYGAVLLRSHGAWLAKVAGLVFVLLGGVQLTGLASGGRDAWAPLAHLTGSAHQPVTFARVQSVAALDAALVASRGKHVMLDFYADWCVSCKEMEKFTFSDPKVRAKLDTMLLLQVDVTANSADDKEMLKRFKLFGPPGIIFFDRQGQEIRGGRVIGYQDSEKFLRSVSLALEF